MWGVLPCPRSSPLSYLLLMEIWVLGTLEASHDGRPLEVRGRLPRRLLSLLALTPGREVPADSLIDGLWGEDAPPGAPATLQSHVARLRRDLPTADLVRTGRSGYLLDVAADEVDAFVLERSVSVAGKALLDGRLEVASHTLERALGLWRGTPYAEFAGCLVLEAEADRLCALRLDGLEQRISADLGRPDVTPPVAELEALVRWHPMRESFWSLLMLAQYRLGRQGEALASYQRARTTLSDELGVDPGPGLRELEQLILAQDPVLAIQRATAFLPPRPSGSYPEPMALLERAQLLDHLTGLHQEAVAGAGRMVLVHGEAGVGKSALVREWSRGAAQAGTQVLWGACDPLSSPRPLGPLLDMAPSLGPAVTELLRSGERDGLFEAALEALKDTGPAVVVVEDLHWTDMSTLDLLRFLARRLETTDLMFILTYRDDQLGPSDPLRVMLGDLASIPVVSRLEVPLLTAAAVATLAADTGLDPAALFQETGGNAFFVTEVVASGHLQPPPTVQDAVLARVQRLSPQARLALECAAVIGSRIEPNLLVSMPEVTADCVDECATAGMLRYDAPHYAFRHEIVRQSVLSGISPGRLGALHWQALDRLRDFPMSPRPLSRLAEHADMAGDGPAVLEFAVAAGDLAAALGSHREAAFQYGRALPHADLLTVGERVDLLGKRATESQVSDDHEHAIAAWDQALVLLRAEGRDLDVVEALMGVDESYYTLGDDSHGSTFVDEALAIVDGAAPCRQQALALTRRGLHLFRQSLTGEAVPWLERGLVMAEDAGDFEGAARAASALGCCRYLLGDQGAGLRLVREGLQMALEHDAEDSAARIYQSLAALTWLDLDLVEGHHLLEEAERYTADRDLHGHLLCVLATEITMKLDLGRWDEALAEAMDLLYVRNTGRASRIEPLVAVALLGARRGDRDDVWTYLDQAREFIARTQTLSYQSFIAVARGEAYLLQGDIESVRREVAPWYDEAIRLEDTETLPDLAMLMWRAGLIDVAPDGMRAPDQLSIEGRHREASAAWTQAGAPYRAAWALLDSSDEVDLREARAMFDRLGARVLVDLTDTRLRQIGAKVPRGARASTRANVGGLTDRESEVLDLLDEGLRNADIAARLQLSEKTVGHHVSAILAKLGASSRLEAVRRARDLAEVG